MDAGDHLDRGVHGHARQSRGDDRDPGAPRGPARQSQRASMDGQRVHAHVRGAALDRGGAGLGRPVRAPAAAGDRHSDLHGGVRGGRAGPVDLDARRRAGRPGLGGAIVMPLTLTVLSAAVPAERRGLALGIWGGISGLAVALGPLVGGAIVTGISWHWIFWLNVPIGLALTPLILLRLDESRGPVSRLDLPGLALASAGLVGIVGGLVRANEVGWTSARILGSFAFGAALLVGFVAWELRTEHPMLPMRFFRNRTFALANVASLLMFFGMFGAIFFISQFFQTVQGLSPFQSGLRILPWTAMPMLVAPIAGALSDRVGGHRLMGVGLTLQAIGLAWIAAVSATTTPYLEFIGAFLISGVGM